jgi:hypothetical protein
MNYRVLIHTWAKAAANRIMIPMGHGVGRREETGCVGCTPCIHGALCGTSPLEAGGDARATSRCHPPPPHTLFPFPCSSVLHWFCGGGAAIGTEAPHALHAVPSRMRTVHAAAVVEEQLLDDLHMQGVCVLGGGGGWACRWGPKCLWGGHGQPQDIQEFNLGLKRCRERLVAGVGWKQTPEAPRLGC